MSLNNKSKIKKNNHDMKVDTAVRTKIFSDVTIIHKIFIGTCYLFGVAAVAASLILAVVSFLVPATAVPVKVMALASSNSVTLTWTAPGDNNDVGLADQYDIRYSTAPITAENFALATAVPNPPQPSIAGSAETFEVTGLNPDTLYYFALKTADEVPNWSSISNLASKRTAAVDACIPSWSCADWSVCQNLVKTRTCLDLNYCGTETNKPETQIACTEIPPSPACQESWSCTAWADCFREYQRRVCTDHNNCGTTVSKPEEIIKCAVGGQEPLGPQDHYLAVSPAANHAPLVKIYRQDLNLYKSFNAYAVNFKQGVNLALGDVDGDGQTEVITGTGASASPQVRIFSVSGQLKNQFFAYASNTRPGLDLTAGDFDGDGRTEIAVSPLSGGPDLKIFKYQPATKTFTVMKEFYVYPKNYPFGLSLAAGDLNNDDRAELIVTPNNSGGPQIMVYSYDPVKKYFNRRYQFFAYAFNMRRGVNLAVGDVDNDGINDIITGPKTGGGPQVRIFDMKGRVKYQFFAASTRFFGGIDVAALDYDSDGAAEVLTGTYSAGSPGVIVFNLEDNRFIQKKFFYAYEQNYREGIRLEGY